MRQVRNDTFADSSRTAWITAILAVLAALLAALGLYGVLAHIVAQQRREIGIRMALGAGVSTVVRQVVRHACGMVAVGLVLGLAATATLTRVLASLLYGVSPLDPLALLLACGAMLGVGLLAAVLPARRAARVQPVTVLREEG